eukprot:gene26332-biopygen15881
MQSKFVTNSCHEEDVRDQNRAGIEAEVTHFNFMLTLFFLFSLNADPREALDRQLRLQLYSGREHPPRDMSSSETGH